MKSGVKGKIMGSKLTPFEKNVLLEVCRIPRGKTATYGQIAKRMGKPGAGRAVGSALKKNPFPVIVPCHRVVGSKGIGGYAGGVEMKRKLLRHEAKR